MQKKIIALFKRAVPMLFAIVFVTVGVAGMSAFEAHVINVTAHIENALSTNTDKIDFGTVFPQEYAEKPFTISLSESFLKQCPVGADNPDCRVDEVTYKIAQKPKCEVKDTPGFYVPCTVGGDPAFPTECRCDPRTQNTLPDLCRFLSKLPQETDTPHPDTGEPSYYNPGPPASCATSTIEAQGILDWSDNDLSDTWKVDLKVPPIAGSVGQDWPASCAAYTVPTDGITYGCDLWIEVNGIQKEHSGGHWPFDENIGNIAHDVSGNGDHGTVHGAAWVGGHINSALSYDGVGNYVDIPGSATLNPQSFTYAFWINNTGQTCTAAGAVCRVISKTSDNFEVGVASGANLSYPANSLQVYTGSAWLNTGYAVPLNTLLPIAVTYDSATKKIDVYANSVPVYSITGPVITHSGELDFGRRVGGAGENFKGIIDEMYLFGEALTPAEIAALP